MGQCVPSEQSVWWPCPRVVAAPQSGDRLLQTTLDNIGHEKQRQELFNNVKFMQNFVDAEAICGDWYHHCGLFIENQKDNLTNPTCFTLMERCGLLEDQN